MAVVEQDKPRSQAGRFVPGQSGNPKGAAIDRVADRAAELFQAMAGEFGELSAVDRTLLNQACLLLARSERMKRTRDADAAVRMSSEARRLLDSLRRHAAPAKAPSAPETFAEVAQRAQAAAQERRARELAEDDMPASVDEAITAETEDAA